MIFRFLRNCRANTLVGYSNNNVKKGFSLSSIQFNTIGLTKKAYKLGDLVPTHADGTPIEDAGGRLSIQTFNKNAGMDKQYFWVGPEDDEDSYPTLGWYDRYDEDAKEIQLDESTGFMISSPFAEDIVFRVAGEVVMQKKEAYLPNGFSLSGNSCATAVKLSNITPLYADDSAVEDAGGRLSIQTFNENAGMDKQYFWVGPEDDEDSYPTLGWYDRYDEDAKDVQLPASKGFMVSNPFENNAIKLVYSEL